MVDQRGRGYPSFGFTDGTQGMLFEEDRSGSEPSIVVASIGTGATISIVEAGCLAFRQVLRPEGRRPHRHDCETAASARLGGA